MTLKILKKMPIFVSRPRKKTDSGTVEHRCKTRENVACVIYNILEKLNVASKTVLMNTDDLYSTLLVITSILQFQNTF